MLIDDLAIVSHYRPLILLIISCMHCRRIILVSSAYNEVHAEKNFSINNRSTIRQEYTAQMTSEHLEVIFTWPMYFIDRTSWMLPSLYTIRYCSCIHLLVHPFTYRTQFVLQCLAENYLNFSEKMKLKQK